LQPDTDKPRFRDPSQKTRIEPIEKLNHPVYYLLLDQSSIETNGRMCAPGDSAMGLYAIFDGGANSERDIKWPVNWLFLDHSLDTRMILALSAEAPIRSQPEKEIGAMRVRRN
jgi:hypothetical protein